MSESWKSALAVIQAVRDYIEVKRARHSDMGAQEDCALERVIAKLAKWDAHQSYPASSDGEQVQYANGEWSRDVVEPLKAYQPNNWVVNEAKTCEGCRWEYRRGMVGMGGESGIRFRCATCARLPKGDNWEKVRG